jgi:hypothetical protein
MHDDPERAGNVAEEAFNVAIDLNCAGEMRRDGLAILVRTREGFADMR